MSSKRQIRDPRKLLHIGADCNRQPLPTHYRGWERIRFDINPRGEADMVGDVRNLGAIEDEAYDAVYLCQVLQFFHPWEVPQILREAVRVTKTGGFVEIRVPHAQVIFKTVIDGQSMDAPLYHTEDGPMTPQNLIHGRIGRTRNAASFMAHRSSFTENLLRRDLEAAGLRVELIGPCSDQEFALFGIGRKTATGSMDPIDELLETVTETV